MSLKYPINLAYQNTRPVSIPIYNFSMEPTTTSTLNNNNNEITHRSNLRNRVIQTIVDIIVIIIVFLAFSIVYTTLNPNLRYFTCDQSDIFYPYKPDTIPFWAVGIYATIGPILLILIVEAINERVIPFICKNKYNIEGSERRKRYFVCVFHALSLFVLGISITLLLTEIGKRWLGRLRPHFIAVCQPNISLLNCTTQTAFGSIYNSIYTGYNFCTNTNTKDISDSRLSFPSGHSSYSAYCMLFLIIYLEARLYLLRYRYIKPLLQMTAFIAAYVTAISRIPDYHHRGSDVIGGIVLGSIVAVFITFFVGRVLWEYEKPREYSDFDLKPRRTTREF